MSRRDEKAEERPACFPVGGQAVIEGVMMRGRYNWAVAVREPDGSIYTEQHDLVSGRSGSGWMHKPVIRGCTALVESLALGYRALEVSADHAFDLSDPEQVDVSQERMSPSARAATDEDGAPAVRVPSDAGVAVPGGQVMRDTQSSPQACESRDTEHADEDGFPKGAMLASMALGVVLAVCIFIIAPAFLANLVAGDIGAHSLRWNLADGLFRVGIFLLYLWLISFMSDIRRMLRYHGAEHKTIHCYEQGYPLVPGQAQRFSRLHPRCGTAFLVITLVVAIIVFALLPVGAFVDLLGVHGAVALFAIVVCSRLLFLPLVAGLAYEVCIKWAGAHPDNPVVKAVIWPGMQLQRLTTREPDDDMVECAIAALEPVLERERVEARVEGDVPVADALPVLDAGSAAVGGDVA